MAKRGKLKERPRELSVRPTITRHYKEFFLIVCEVNPNTTVHKLVKELREWLEYYKQ